MTNWKFVIVGIIIFSLSPLGINNWTIERFPSGVISLIIFTFTFMLGVILIIRGVFDIPFPFEKDAISREDAK